MAGKTYVRITYLPRGTKRRRTTWAVKLRETASRLIYLVCDKFGDTEQDAGTSPEGLPIERSEMIIATKEEVTERPARMNPKYAELEIVRKGT